MLNHDRSRAGALTKNGNSQGFVALYQVLTKGKPGVPSGLSRHRFSGRTGDQANAARRCEVAGRRRSANPARPKPAIMSSHVAGSGTALGFGVSLLGENSA